MCRQCMQIAGKFLGIFRRLQYFKRDKTLLYHHFFTVYNVQPTLQLVQANTLEVVDDHFVSSTTSLDVLNS